jgi:hypothetical protein
MLFAAPLAAEAQQVGKKPPTLGVLCIVGGTQPGTLVDARSKKFDG